MVKFLKKIMQIGNNTNFSWKYMTSKSVPSKYLIEAISDPIATDYLQKVGVTISKEHDIDSWFKTARLNEVFTLDVTKEGKEALLFAIPGIKPKDKLLSKEITKVSIKKTINGFVLKLVIEGIREL